MKQADAASLGAPLVSLLLLAVFLSVCEGNSEFLEWHDAENPRAICNDFSRAGFFVRRVNSTKWVIFLESGGLCYSSATCNRRYLDRRVSATNPLEVYVYTAHI